MSLNSFDEGSKTSSKSSLQGFWASLKIIVPCIPKRKKIIDEENLTPAQNRAAEPAVLATAAAGEPSDLTPAQNRAAEPAVLATAAAGEPSDLVYDQYVTEKLSPSSSVQGSASMNSKNENAEIPSTVVTDESIVSQQSKTDSLESPAKGSENDVMNESQWLDAEDFFNEMGDPHKSPFLDKAENNGGEKVTLLSVSTIESVSEALTDNTNSSYPDSSVNQTQLEGRPDSPKSETIQDISSRNINESVGSDEEHIESVDTISQVPTGSVMSSSSSKVESDVNCAVNSQEISNNEPSITEEGKVVDNNSNSLVMKTATKLKEHEENLSPPTKANQSTDEEINDGEVFWFDEDLQPVSLQTQLEAEELRLKQLQIEQETPAQNRAAEPAVLATAAAGEPSDLPKRRRRRGGRKRQPRGGKGRRKRNGDEEGARGRSRGPRPPI